MRPNCPELKLVTGSPQLKWLSTLNDSRRSSTRRMPIGITREIPMSIFQYAGPTSALRVRLPSAPAAGRANAARSEEHTSELQSPMYLVCRLLLEKKKKTTTDRPNQHEQ